jgi:hypothetical protein
VFFAGAAAWGFLIGSAAILVGLAATGNRAEVGAPTWMTLALALVVAVLGGLVASRAYREAASRR